MNVKEFIKYIAEAKRLREAAMEVGKPSLNKEFNQARSVSVEKDEPRINDTRKVSPKGAKTPELATHKVTKPTAVVGKPELNIAFQGRRKVPLEHVHEAQVDEFWSFDKHGADADPSGRKEPAFRNPWGTPPKGKPAVSKKPTAKPAVKAKVISTKVTAPVRGPLTISTGKIKVVPVTSEQVQAFTSQYGLQEMNPADPKVKPRVNDGSRLLTGVIEGKRVVILVSKAGDGKMMATEEARRNELLGLIESLTSPRHGATNPGELAVPAIAGSDQPAHQAGSPTFTYIKKPTAKVGTPKQNFDYPEWLDVDVKQVREEADQEITDLLRGFVKSLGLSEKYMGFDAVKKGAAASGARDPGAVAAAVGRKKYGKKAFQNAAATGHKMHENRFRWIGESKYPAETTSHYKAFGSDQQAPRGLDTTANDEQARTERLEAQKRVQAKKEQRQRQNAQQG